MQIKNWLCIFCVLCAGKLHAQGETELALLHKYMSGSFSSAQQSKSDSDFYDIRLHMAPIWPEQKDGYWLYVEQAVATAQDKPYRQRIYHIVALSDTTFESSVYEFSNPLQYAGAWKDAGLLNGLSKDSLQLRDGCSIFLTYHRSDNTFSGATGKSSCPSNLRGASYATSEVTISADMLVSWDRGWDASGKQVWGAVKSGYRFIKDEE